MTGHVQSGYLATFHRSHQAARAVCIHCVRAGRVVADGEVIPPATKHMVHIGTGDSTYTFKGLTAGPHELVAVIGYGDHSAMGARRDTVHFVVKK